jgi:aldose 1-epimerase
MLSPDKFNTEFEGKQIKLFTLTSGGGITMQITNYGCRIVSLFVPDKNGVCEDIVMGFDNITDYIQNKGGERFLGATIGRFANRIADAKFSIDDVTYTLPESNAPNCLHGGFKGFDSHVWDVDNVTGNSITLNYISEDDDEGFPGTVKVKINYTLSQDNELTIKYEATTDKKTHINLTHHSYFNLKGCGESVTEHILAVYADKYLPVNAVQIPLGILADVKGTPFDFTTPVPIKKHIDDNNEQLKTGNGYDHHWAVNSNIRYKGLNHAVTLYEPQSGRTLNVYSNQEGVQIYTGNFFTGNVIGKYNKPLLYQGSIAIETSKFPDTPNQPNFPTTIVEAGKIYSQTCIYKFT